MEPNIIPSCTHCLDARSLHSPIALAELVASVQVVATLIPGTITCVEVAIRLHVVGTPQLDVRRLVLLRRLPGLCSRNGNDLLDTVHLCALVLPPIHVQHSDTRLKADDGLNQVRLAAKEE
jgi:hypothetical protein